MMSAHSKINNQGVRHIDLQIEKDAIDDLIIMWKTFISNLPSYPENKFKGKGIVMCAGGIKYFTCSWIAIKNLRDLGCRLPIELWHLENELPDYVIAALQSLEVDCRSFGRTNLTGWGLKPLSIIESSFEEILFLDADNNCLQDPEYLFNSSEFREQGAIFWPDYWKTSSDNPIWQITESVALDLREQESGQILIHKKKSWEAINLTLFFNIGHKLYYKLLFGDKDTFKFAWLALKKEFHMICTPPKECGWLTVNHKMASTTMVQHDMYGNILFLHRNLYKWDVTMPGEYIWQHIGDHPSFAENENPRENEPSDLKADRGRIRKLEEHCLFVLDELRSTGFYTKYLIDVYIRENRDQLYQFTQQ